MGRLLLLSRWTALRLPPRLLGSTAVRWRILGWSTLPRRLLLSRLLAPVIEVPLDRFTRTAQHGAPSHDRQGAVNLVVSDRCLSVPFGLRWRGSCEDR